MDGGCPSTLGTVGLVENSAQMLFSGKICTSIHTISYSFNWGRLGCCAASFSALLFMTPLSLSFWDTTKTKVSWHLIFIRPWCGLNCFATTLWLLKPLSFSNCPSTFNFSLPLTKTKLKQAFKWSSCHAIFSAAMLPLLLLLLVCLHWEVSRPTLTFFSVFPCTWHSPMRVGLIISSMNKEDKIHWS